MERIMSEATGNSGKANGLGENKIKPWNPGSVGGYSRGLQKNIVKPVESETRKGAGQK
jgi:hypothetical protein